jgi:two-component system sensor histidine kinase AlgZ
VNPILVRRGRLGLYLISWAPLVPLTVLLLRRGGIGWGEALAEGFPLVFVYAYLCLAAWYVCRVAPLKPVQPLLLTVAQGVAAALSSAAWVLLGWGWAALLDTFPDFGGAAGRFAGLAPQLFAVGVPLYLAAAAVHYLVLALDESQEADRRTLEAKVQAREAELRALKAQIDPHFLFNALNAISSLAGSDPMAARRMTLLLAEFLRRSLRLGSRGEIPLAEELAHAASYLAVERVRFGERLRVEEEVDAGCLRCRVPSLILQPLVENAVRHGIAQLLERGSIRIAARREDGTLRLTVENPCDPDHRPLRGEGVGLANVSARLRALHGRRAGLAVTPTPGLFRVEVFLPALDIERREEGWSDGV